MFTLLSTHHALQAYSISPWTLIQCYRIQLLHMPDPVLGAVDMMMKRLGPALQTPQNLKKDKSIN